MLKYEADRRTLVFILLFYVCLGIGYVVDPASWAVRIPLIALTSWLAFTTAVITHNTVHAPMFYSKRLNRIAQVLLTCSYGHPVSTFVPGHNLGHHLATETPRDVMRTSKARFKINALNQLFFSLIVSKAIMRGEIEYARAMRARRPAWFRQLMIETVCFGIFVVTLLVLDWQAFLMYVFIPYQFAAWGIVGINYVQHDGCDAEGINIARNFDGRIINWFLFNNGFHTIHHMEPSLHWSLLREAHEEKVAPFAHPNLCLTSLAAYAFSAFIWPGKRLRYDGTPVRLPDPVPDESWVPRPEDVPNASLGAEDVLV